MNPSPKFNLTSRSVFSVPELASVISSFCADQERARLLRTSKVLFRAAVPFVWNFVPRVKLLLLLISGTYERPLPTNIHDHIVFCLPFTPTDGMFDRFEVYAPYVKHLYVELTYKIIGWHTLLSRARKQPLLPNLHALSIRTFYWTGPEFGLWPIVFSSPTLTSFAMLSDSDSPQLTSHFTASIIMRSLVVSCPKLERLELFPDSRYDTDEANNPWECLCRLSYDPFYSYLSRLTTLVTLCCTTDWLIDDSLSILGQIRCLAHLEVSQGAYKLTNTPELPLNSFCSLKSAILRNLTPFNLIGFMDIVPLVNSLVSLSIQSKMEEDLLPEDMSLEAWLNVDFLPLLLNAPHLATFKMDYGAVELNIRGLHVFQQLPLQVLALASMTFVSEVKISNLAAAFPHLTYLALPSLEAGLTALNFLSALPALQDLRVRLRLRPEPWDMSTSHNSGLLVLNATLGSVVCAKFKEMDIVVRALLEMFPSLTRVEWPTENMNASQKGSFEFFSRILSDRRKKLAFKRSTQS